MKQQEKLRTAFDFDDFSVKLHIATALLLITLLLAYLAIVK